MMLYEEDVLPYRLEEEKCVKNNEIKRVCLFVRTIMYIFVNRKKQSTVNIKLIVLL
jgi:hypothetical protein